MNRTFFLPALAAFPLWFAGCKAATGGSTPAASIPIAMRKSLILDTLKFKNPDLANENPVISELKPSVYPGLDEVTLTLSLPSGQRQPVTFFITSDNRAFFLSEPIDASRTLKELKAERAAQFAKLVEGLPVRGNPAAQVTIVEFSDFQCPACRQAYPVIREVLRNHPDDVRFIYKQFPLSEIHPWARPASIISMCAARQNPAAFWKLHDAYFTQAGLNEKNLMAVSRAVVAGEKLDEAKWSDCISNPVSEERQAVEATLANSLKEGPPLGVQGTPTFFLNGRQINLRPPGLFDPLIDAAKRGED